MMCGKVSFADSVTIIENLLFSTTPTKESKMTPMDRDLSLIRSLLIVAKLNVDQIILMGRGNPLLPRIILEDTVWNGFNTFLKQNITFKSVNLDNE